MDFEFIEYKIQNREDFVLYVSLWKQMEDEEMTKENYLGEVKVPLEGLLEVPRCERLAKWVIRAQIPPHAAEFSASSGGDFGVPVSFSVKWKNISQQ